MAWDEGDVSTVSWGLKEVSCQFSELYSWLRVLQELVYSKEENLLDKSLRVVCELLQSTMQLFGMMLMYSTFKNCHNESFFGYAEKLQALKRTLLLGRGRSIYRIFFFVTL